MDTARTMISYLFLIPMINVQLQLLKPKQSVIEKPELEPMASFESLNAKASGLWITETQMDLWQKCAVTEYV